jgi:hypothetical protein
MMPTPHGYVAVQSQKIVSNEFSTETKIDNLAIINSTAGLQKDFKLSAFMDDEIKLSNVTKKVDYFQSISKSNISKSPFDEKNSNSSLYPMNSTMNQVPSAYFNPPPNHMNLSTYPLSNVNSLINQVPDVNVNSSFNQTPNINSLTYPSTYVNSSISHVPNSSNYSLPANVNSSQVPNLNLSHNHVTNTINYDQNVNSLINSGSNVISSVTQVSSMNSWTPNVLNQDQSIVINQFSTVNSVTYQKLNATSFENISSSASQLRTNYMTGLKETKLNYGRPPCVIVSFGFGGKLVTMTPQYFRPLNPLLISKEELTR